MKDNLRSLGAETALLTLLVGAVVFQMPRLALQAAAPVVTPLGSCSHSLQSPGRVAADPAGRAYVTDPASGRLLVFDAFGRLAATRTGLDRPLAVAVDTAGTIFLSDEQTRSVSAFDADGKLLYKLGSGDGEFALPNHLAVDPAPGSNTVYVCDGRAHEIKAYRDGVLQRRFGRPGSWEGEFQFPAGLAVSEAGEIFVVDQGNDRVQVFDRAGVFQRAFRLGKTGMGLGGISGRSQGIALDAEGRIYVADTFQGVVKVFSAQGSLLSSHGGFGEAPGQLRSPVSLAIDRYNRLLVASANNGRVELFGLDSYLHFTAASSGPFSPAGTDLVLSVVAGGPGPFTCQWRKGASDLADSGNVSGAASATLTLTGVNPADSGDYTVVLNGPSGSVTSSIASVSVLVPPSILQGPASQVVVVSSNATFTVLAAGDMPLRYQWRKDGCDLPGQTNAILELAGLQDSSAGGYDVVVSNPVGSAASTSAVLTMNHPPLPGGGLAVRSPFGGAALRVADLVANDRDPDGDPVSLLAVDPVTTAGGAASLSGEWILYSPPPGGTNADSITYTLGDGRGGLAAGAYAIEVLPYTERIENFGAGLFRIVFARVPGQTCWIQYSDNLNATNWQTLTNLVADPLGICEFFDAPPVDVPRRFYRSP